MQIVLLLLNIFGAVSLFIYGMKVMSEGVQRASGRQLQTFLNKMTGNPYSGAFAGTVFTTALQSSSIVSLLTLSFVNAGLLNLKKSFSIIVGANVGTTLKLWIIIFLGASWHIESLALPLIAVSVPFFFFRNQKFKEWANFAIGLALVFVGLYFLKEFLPDFSSNPYFHELIQKYTGETTILNSLIFVLIGIVVTFLFHSSSVFILFAAVLVTKGMPLEQAAMMILGANIGTTSTALIASAIGNQRSKIVAWFHFFLNLAGAVLFFFFVPLIISFLSKCISQDGEIILVSFHTFFNVVSAIFILPFINPIVNFISKKYLNDAESENSLKLIGRPFGPTAKMYVYEANREVIKFAGITRQIINNLGRMITESDDGKSAELRQRIFMLEKESDELEKSILSYLNTIYTYEMSGEVALNIHRLIDICHHLESIGDIAIKTASVHKQRKKNNSFITPKLRANLIELHDSLSVATTTLVQNLNETEGKVNLREAKNNEKSIDKRFKEAEEALMKAIDAEKLSALSALYYKDIILHYELIGDHLFQANKALEK